MFNELKYFTRVNLHTDGYSVNGEFYGCKNLVEIDLTNITIIGSSSFVNCSKLKKLNNLRENILVSVSGAPLMNCSSLEGEIDLTNGHWYKGGIVTVLEVQVFRETGYSVIRLPKDTTKITAGYVFYRCRRLTALIVPSESLVTITSTTFDDMPSTTKIYVPDDLVDSYKAASYWSARASYIKPISEYTG